MVGRILFVFVFLLGANQTFAADESILSKESLKDLKSRLCKTVKANENHDDHLWNEIFTDHGLMHFLANDYAWDIPNKDLNDVVILSALLLKLASSKSSASLNWNMWWSEIQIFLQALAKSDLNDLKLHVQFAIPSRIRTYVVVPSAKARVKQRPFLWSALADSAEDEDHMVLAMTYLKQLEPALCVDDKNALDALLKDPSHFREKRFVFEDVMKLQKALTPTPACTERSEVEDLITKLDDPDWHIRSQATTALLRVRDQDTEFVIQSLKADRPKMSPEQNARAERIVYELQPEENLESLCPNE